MMKKRLALLLSLVMILSVFAGCGDSGSAGNGGGGQGSTTAPPASNPPADDGTVYTLKIATQTSETHAACQSMYLFEQLVEERTNGKVQVEVYFGGTLGNDRDLIESVQAGTVEMACVTTSPVASFVPEIGALDLPFIIDNWDTAFAFRNSEAADLIQEKLSTIGLVEFGYISTGCRHITNNKQPINTLADLSGMKIRVMESDMFINTFKALGAAPSPMAWSEVPTSLQQGTIDGQENPVQTIYEQGVYEYQKYLSMTGHVCTYMMYIINQNKLNELPEEYQTVILESGEEATDTLMKQVEEDEEKLLQELQDKGMIVNTIEDKTPFVEATQSVYDEFTKTYGSDIVDAIRNLSK